MSRLTVHKRVHLSRDDKTSTSAFVRCPEGARWAPADACRQCTEHARSDESSVACAAARESLLGRSPEEASIAEVMSGSVLCVDGDATAEAATRALDEQDAPIAVVIDSGRHAVGVVTREDLALRSPSRRVARCMTPSLVTMLEGASVADAIDLVAEHGVSYVPVLGEGRVVGVVTPRAIIRWLTQNLRAARRRGAPRAGGSQIPGNSTWRAPCSREGMLVASNTT